MGSKREKRYQPKRKLYLQFPSRPFKINSLHRFNIIGPRYLKGNGYFYAHNLMDVGSHNVAISPKRFKDHEKVAVLSLKESWEIVKIPYIFSN